MDSTITSGYEELKPSLEDRGLLADQLGGDNESLKICCQKTVKLHAENNPMMVCGDCKQIIKCFENEKAYRNYQRFCRSRHRKILATDYEGWYVIVFKSYDTYPG